LLFPALLKAILCIVIRIHNRHPNTRFLIIFLCLMIVFDLNVFLQNAGGPAILMLILYNHTLPLSFMHGPLLFIYVRNTLNDNDDFSKRDFLHFIPAVLILLDFLPYFSLPIAAKQDIIRQIMTDPRLIRQYSRGWLLTHFQIHILRWLMWFGYLIAIGVLLILQRKNEKRFRQVPRAHFQVTYRWLVTLTTCLFLILIPYMKVILDFHQDKATMAPNQYLQSSAFIVNITLHAIALLSILVYPQVLYGMPQASLPSESPDESVHQIEELTIAPPMISSQVPDNQIIQKEMEKQRKDPFEHLARSIEEYIEQERPYLNPEFSISTISHRLKVPQHHVHYCFSNIFQTGFPSYRNRLRVEHAKKLLTEGKGQNLTLDGIGRQSGFSSKPIFYAAFRKETGLTPGDFQTQLEDKGPQVS
jgi:AraC-like DNA-binding protein